MCSTNITLEEYLQEQIKKASGWQEDIFAQAAKKEVTGDWIPKTVVHHRIISEPKVAFPKWGRKGLGKVLWHGM